tara:strand:+ start:961 stop:4059 length:3099 start_codon:yes stop_codon:yes gene_type:complete
MAKIALLPGGFKPPHAGHYNMAKWLAANTDADTVLVKVGAKEREGITREMSLKLWNLYTQKDNNIKIKASESPSPVRDVYDFIEQEAPEGSTVYLGMGEKDIEDKRFANIGKFAEPKGIKFKTILVPPQAGGISGTQMRDFVKNDNKESFQKYLPDHINKEEAWDIVSSVNEDLYDPNDKVLDYMKSSDPNPKDDIPPSYKYKRGGIYGRAYENREGRKKLRVYDFDDTLAITRGANIKVKHADGSVDTLDPAQFAVYKGQPGDKFDFTEFDSVIKDAEPIQNIVSMLRKDLTTTAKVTILTARLLAYPVRRYLKTLGLDVYVVAVGSSDPNDKAKWIENHIKKGYDDILFIDDSEKNRNAVISLEDKYPNIKLNVLDPDAVQEMMMGMMSPAEKKKHNKNMKRLSKDLKRINKGGSGSNYGGGGYKVPKYVKGTLTRKLREFTDQELKYWALYAHIAKKLDAPDSEETYLRLKNELTGEELDALNWFYNTYFKNENYPPYKADQVQKVRYQASDTFTNSPKQAKKRGYLETMNCGCGQNPCIHTGVMHEADPKVGTGKKPKGSGRRLYTDENPKDTVKVKFSTRQDIVDTLTKKSFKSKPHKRKSQIINLIHQRVRAALGRAKDPAVKKRLRSAFNYIKKRKEASKRKTQRMKETKLFSIEWWSNQLNEIITEGGAAGHMAHPFNLSNVNNGRDLLNIFEKSADSLDRNPGAVKIDGVNSSIRLVDLDGKKQFVMDRGSKKELDVKGITKDDLLRRFGDGHGMVKVGGEVLDLFNSALPNIKNDLVALGVFNDPNILFNMEYVSGKTNVQEYGSNFIAIHGLNKIENKEVQGKRGPLTKRISSEISYDKNALKSLLNNLEPIAKKRGYEIYGSVPTKMTKKPNFNAALSKTYTVNAGEKSETKSLKQWLDMVNDIPEEDFIFMNVDYEKDSSTVNRKKVGAVSKQVYLAILNGENIDGLFEDSEERKKAVQGFVTYLATEKLGDEVLKVLSSPMGSVENHEGVVIRDKNIANVPFKITGKFILGGLATSFR